MTEQKQPKRWAEVVAKPEFQALDPMTQERMRHQYFDEIVAPQVAPANYGQAWEEFDAHSKKAINLSNGQPWTEEDRALAVQEFEQLQAQLPERSQAVDERTMRVGELSSRLGLSRVSLNSESERISGSMPNDQNQVDQTNARIGQFNQSIGQFNDEQRRLSGVVDQQAGQVNQHNRIVADLQLLERAINNKPVQSSGTSEGPGVVGNTGRRIADRASDLVGNLGIGIGKAAEAGGDFAADVTGINPGVVWGDGQGLRFTMNMPDDVNDIGDAMQSQGEAVRDYDAGYQPNFTWDRLKGDLSVGNLAGYIVEQGGGSIPDMIAAVTMLPAYIATRTEEVAGERATNDGREAPGGRDYAVAAPTAVAMSVLERLGAKGILGEKEVGTAMDLLKETGRAAGKEAGTEFVQEGMEYTATTAGTETGYDPVTMLDRGAAGAVAGGGIGGVGRAATGGAEMAGVKQTEQGRQTRAEEARRAAEQADIDFEVKMRQLQESMRGDFEPNAPRIEGAQAVPQADFYAGTDGTVTAEQQTQREMPQAGPDTQQQPQGFGVQREPAAEPQQSLAPEGITFEDWDDANDAITFDESDIEPEIANIAEMAEFAGMVGVPRQAIESALSLNDEQETISALEDMVATAQSEINPPEVTPNAVDARAESQNPEQAGQPEPALRGEPENRPEAAGIPRAPESGRTENGAEAEAEPSTELTPDPVALAAPVVQAPEQTEPVEGTDSLEFETVNTPDRPEPAEVEALQTRAQTARDKAGTRAEGKAAQERPAADDDLVSATMQPVEPSPTTPAQDIDTAANEAATSPMNDIPDPTPAQIESGNYRKGHIRVNGLDVSIENPRGSTRSGTDPDGKEWSNNMAHHYGYIRGTEAADSEQVDVFVGPDPDSNLVFVIDQVNADGSYDEVKAMLGFKNQKAARDGYRANYDTGWKVGPTTRMTIDQFKEWLKGDTTKPVSDKVKAAPAQAEADQDSGPSEARPPLGGQGSKSLDPKRRIQPFDYTGYSGEKRKVNAFTEVGEYRVARVRDNLYEVVDAEGRAISQMAGRNGAIRKAQDIQVKPEKSAETPSEASKDAPSFIRRATKGGGPGLSIDKVQATVEGFLSKYPGAADVTTQIHESTATLPGHDAERDANASIAGQYDAKTDTIHLVGDSFTDNAEVEAALREEILVHKGLGFFAPEDRQQLYQDIQQAVEESPAVRALWEQTVRDYQAIAESANLNEEQANRLYAEEMLGSLAQQRVNWLKRGWETIRRGIKRLLVKAGWIKNSIGIPELRSRIDMIARAFEKGRQAPRRNFTQDIRNGATDGESNEPAAQARSESESPQAVSTDESRDRGVEEGSPESSSEDDGVSAESSPSETSPLDIETRQPPASGGMPAKEVQAVVDRMSEAIPGNVSVVQNIKELPERYRFMRQANGESGPRGFFDSEDGTIYLIADNIKDTAEAERTYVHEVVGHAGIKAAFGSELNGYLDNLYKQIPNKKLKPFMDRYGLRAHRSADRRAAVEEYIAYTAELSGRKPHWFKRLIARVRDWLRSIGAVESWTNEDLYALVAQSNNPTVDTMLAQSMASLSALRTQMDQPADGLRMAMSEDGQVTAEENTDSALGMLYGFAYAGHTVYPVNPGATKAETLFRHYGYTGNIDADAAANMPGQRDPVDAIIGKMPNSGRGGFDFKIVDTGSSLPYAVMLPAPNARQGVALYQAAMDWAHNNGKKLRPDPAGLSPVNYLRRSEAMLASMMRNGTSRHLEPDYTQFTGLLDDADYDSMVNSEYDTNVNALLKQFKARLWGNEGQGPAGEAVARANAHNMAATALALTLRRKPELLNYRADSQGNIYEISSNASAKPKRIAGPASAIREIQKKITVSDVANGVGARTALRAILAQSALLGPNGPRDLAGAISAITDSLALFHKGQVERMPARALLPDVVIRRMARAYSDADSQQQRIYYSLKDPEKHRTVDEILNMKHQSPLARAVNWASKQGDGLTGQKYGALTLRQLSEVSRKTLPHIKAYVSTIHRMMTRRNQMAEDAVTIANEVQKWAARNATEADTLFDLMHEATLAEVDPAEPFVSRKDMLDDRVKILTERIRGVGGESAQSGRKKRLTDELADIKKQIKDEPRREINHERLSPIWDKLSPEAKKHYKTMKAKYEQRHEIFMKLMEARIQNADIEERVKRRMIAEMRYEFESNTLGGVYFPLARFGDYWVETSNENGERLFTTYESERAQSRAVKELSAANMPVTSGKFLHGSGEVDGVSLGFVQEVMETIDSSNVNEQLSTELGDAIYQLYLQALPTRSMRKNFIHRKGVQGFHRDAIRTFADNMMKGSHQLARLEYQDELSDLMVDMQKAAKKGSNTAADLYNEMVKRHEWVMNPTNSVGAQKITSIGFIWMLGITPAAAVVNTTQNMVVALPVLASKFGWAKAATELAKASGEFLGSIPAAISDKASGKEDPRAWSIRNGLKGAEREAYDELVDLGVIDVTQAHNLAGIAETDAYRYSDTGHKVMAAVSYLFHKAEVYNRETSGIAAYRLAKASGMDHPKAVQYAADAVWDSHFDYTNTNRARFMQKDWQKVAFQFKQYSQNITYYLVRNAKRAMYDPALGLFGKQASTTKAEQREAAVQLAGTLAISVGLGGVTTLPLIGVINHLVNALLDDDEDDPWDAQTEVKQWIVDQVGQDLGEKIIWGAGGAGLSGRVTLDGLWIRDPYRDMGGEDLWTHYAQQAMGPVIGGVLVSSFRGAQDISEGRPWTGVEKFLPKAFRDVSKAIRYGEEGALTRQGYPLKGEWTFPELALQALGIADHDLMKRYDANSAIRSYDIAVANRKSALLSQYYLAYSNGDDALRRQIMIAIRRFNDINPDHRITRSSIQSSIRTQIRNARTNEAGMRMDRGLKTIKDRITYGD